MYTAAIITATLVGSLSQGNASYVQTVQYYGSPTVHSTPIHPSVVDHDRVRYYHPEAYRVDRHPKLKAGTSCSYNPIRGGCN